MSEVRYLRLASASTTEAADLPADYTYEKWVDDLQGIAWNYVIKGEMSVEDMAARAHLHPATVEKFVWRETKRPAGSTIYEMARVLGFRCPWIPIHAPRQPDEQDFSSLREQLPMRRAS